jgi:hypothetical protein
MDPDQVVGAPRGSKIMASQVWFQEVLWAPLHGLCRWPCGVYTHQVSFHKVHLLWIWRLWHYGPVSHSDPAIELLWLDHYGNLEQTHFTLNLLASCTCKAMSSCGNQYINVLVLSPSTQPCIIHWSRGTNFFLWLDHYERLTPPTCWPPASATGCPVLETNIPMCLCWVPLNTHASVSGPAQQKKLLRLDHYGNYETHIRPNFVGSYVCNAMAVFGTHCIQVLVLNYSTCKWIFLWSSSDKFLIWLDHYESPIPPNLLASCIRNAMPVFGTLCIRVPVMDPSTPPWVHFWSTRKKLFFWL